MEIKKKSFQLGQHTVVLETGQIARQASGACLVRIKDTVVLVTVVGVSGDAPADRDFFPLTVNYQEKTYAAGNIPGGYFRREGRPTERETLISRLIDRPLRPLFPEGFYNDVQIVATVLSLDPDIDPDIAALIGSSAAVALSGIPFHGPIGAVRVGYKDGQYLLNPTYTELASSDLNLVVAGTAAAVLMVESEANELSETVMLGAVMYGHQQMQTIIQAIREFAAEAGSPPWNWKAMPADIELEQTVAQMVEADLVAAYQIQEKQARRDRISELKTRVLEKLCPLDADDLDIFPEDVTKVFSDLESRIVRNRILDNKPRIDGRDTKTVRPISIQTSILPRTHGSALFTRGETQAIVVATLGTERDAQLIEELRGEVKETFMLHYNFPPYSVGEVGMVGAPKRREIGHGRLARRAIQAVLPDQKAFPYVLRVVSEITESNGSSSMASVCGTSLALMDAGVPIKSPVAGIAMGLVKEGDKYAVLTDILGDEDHLGDMDFKVAGTSRGVTALQMDIKIQGITREIMETALEQAREGRVHILNVMNQVLSAPRTTLSDYAPRITTIRINPEKIRDVIGKGGTTIRSIIEETGVNSIDITDDGIVSIASINNAAAEAALKKIEGLTVELEIGQIYEGKVIKLMDFGAVVSILPGKDGLVHISQIANERIKQVSDKLSEGQMVRVKVLEIDRQGKVRLSMKEVGDLAST